ncbi:MAG: S16 family serine protease [Candidatus Micrarchaeota archaeon]
MRFFLILIILLPFVFSSCSGELSHYIPAVIGDGGGLVNVTMRIAPGSGETYITVSPRIGTSTQESLQNAATYWQSLSNNECDIFVSFPGRNTESIDGPSGGATFSLMIYALLSNNTIRDDSIITGSMDKFGNVGSVGGLYEKAKGVSSIGATYFITPEENLYETFMLKNAGEKYNITILQVKNMDEIIDFMIYDKPIEKTELDSKKRPIPNLTEYDYSGIERFKTVAEKIIDLENQTVSNMITNDNESMIVKEFFENEVSRQTIILDKGYLFTGANEAFVNYIDLSTIKAIIMGEINLPRKKENIERCLASISRPNMTDKNFEWIIGADLRQGWAYDKLSTTKIDGLLKEEEYFAYNEIMYSQAWCEVGTGLIGAAEPEGIEINENEWREIAEKKLIQAKNIEMNDEDLKTRLRIAEEAYGDGRYGAAIYDAVFVIVNSQSLLDELNMSIINESRSSLWGQVYQSHAVFLYSQNQTKVAYITAKYAEELDDITEEMRRKLVPLNSSDETQSQLYYGLIVLGSVFLLIVVVIIIKRRSYGNNGPGYRKTNRTK